MELAQAIARPKKQTATGADLSHFTPEQQAEIAQMIDAAIAREQNRQRALHLMVRDGMLRVLRAYESIHLPGLKK